MKKTFLLSLFILTAFYNHSFGQKLAQAYNITYDESFRPKLTIRLHNKLSKEVSHIVYQFQFANMSGMQNTSVNRYLASQSTTQLTRVTNLKPGYTLTESFLIPLPDSDSSNEPKVKILVVRYTN
jgi:hypothetical protein